MSKIRVALIEDHDLTRVGIRTALQQSDSIEVVGDAANATEGLKLLQSSKPDVALAASPTTSIVSRCCRAVRMPTIVRSWSSINATRILVIFFPVVCSTFKISSTDSAKLSQFDHVS